MLAEIMNWIILVKMLEFCKNQVCRGLERPISGNLTKLGALKLEKKLF